MTSTGRRRRARLNPNRVLHGKTDHEGTETARSLRGRPCARAGRVRLRRRRRRRRCWHDDQRHHDRGRRLQPVLSQAKLEIPGAVSSVGRAPARQAGGHWFEPSTAHLTKAPLRRGFLVFGARSCCRARGSVAAEWLRPEFAALRCTERRRPSSRKSAYRRFPARKRKGRRATRFVSTMRAVPAVEGAECCARVAPVRPGRIATDRAGSTRQGFRSLPGTSVMAP
jgi:hypothetical protein